MVFRIRQKFTSPLVLKIQPVLIGRRHFARFIGGYVEPMKAKYLSVGTGRVLGECSNLAGVTWGQGAAIGGHPYRSAPAPPETEKKRTVYRLTAIIAGASRHNQKQTDALQQHVVGALFPCCNHCQGSYVCLEGS